MIIQLFHKTSHNLKSIQLAAETRTKLKLLGITCRHNSFFKETQTHLCFFDSLWLAVFRGGHATPESLSQSLLSHTCCSDVYLNCPLWADEKHASPGMKCRVHWIWLVPQEPCLVLMRGRAGSFAGLTAGRHGHLPAIQLGSWKDGPLLSNSAGLTWCWLRYVILPA